MKFSLSRWAMAAIVASAMLVLGGSAQASEGAEAAVQSTDAGQSYSLRLRHLHSGESLDVIYRVGDTYIPAALDKLNYFLRDHRTEDEKSYDPKTFDLLNTLMEKLGRPNGVIDIVCGYRTPWTNNLLRARSPNTGVAKHSQHVLAKAIDIRVPGVSTLKLRDTALSLGEGGVGYYPVSKFVHVDVGPVRQWSFGNRKPRRTVRSTSRRAARTHVGE